MKAPLLRCIGILRTTMSILFASIILAACGGGGGDGGNNDIVDDPGDPVPTTGATTQFTGGSMDDLKALNPNLTFDHLEISGDLDLAHYSSETISVNSLTVTADGSIGYSYSECTYVDAPSITIDASGDVILEGNIDLQGRSGKRVTTTSSCSSCYGEDGGNVTINAGRITVSGQINAYGGSGGTMVYIGFPSSGCSGGASGDVSLTAADIDLSGSEINDRRGSGGQGGSGRGANGASGNVDLAATNTFEMLGGAVFSTGILSFEANQANICGPITYETLNGSIGGEQDITPPDLSIQSPVDGSGIPWNEPLDVVVQVGDAGMGVKEIQITGFGYDETHSGTEVQDGILTISIPSASNPASLDVTVWDNAGHSTVESASQLSLTYKQEAEPNDSSSAAQVLNIPDTVEGDIHIDDSGVITPLVNMNSNGEHKIEDWYVFTPANYSTVRININFSGGDNSTDLDLYLFDGTASNLIASSIDDNQGLGTYTETIAVNLDAVSYILGVQAWRSNASVAYTLRIE